MTEKKSAKPWWESRTIWLNIVVGAVGVVEASSDVLKSIVPPEVLGGVLVGTALINVFLRSVTGQPVAAKRAPPAHEP